MSETTDGRWPVPDRLSRTGRAVRLALGRRDSLAVVLAVTVLYLGVYLLAIGDLAIRSGFGVGYVVVGDPLARMVEPTTSQFTWEAVALVNLEVVRLLVSPLNIGLGLVLAGLVGINLGVTYLTWRHPKACGIDGGGAGSGTGILAAVPALLSGSACCGPVVLIALGVSASGALLTVFEWLLPVGVALLLASLVYSGGKMDPVGAAHG
ncbi:hypothetical protein [Haloarchaeobius amylolyticus]|uniref:hypothetical protein n=1 Tax=Haloarchaeobius amylolyticus TaxID=1198296 RepID=UPI00226F9A0B|nr:hypothetical protein [Haloarchaeobius amylolyticus]